jgi:simple sugar transport system ATP-binding protein
MADVILKLEGIKKSFSGVKALKGVDLEIRKGEIHCLAGENGSGKSTLIKVISGVHDATEGNIYIEGNKIDRLTPIEAIRHGIQVIYQDFAVFPNMTVAENIAMNRALLTGAKRMNWKEARKIAIEAMEQIGANMDPDMHVERLSVANKQMVAICRAIINDAKLLILDEPTTALTSKEVDKLNGIIRRLKEKGFAIVIVNHKLDEIYEIADYLTIIRNGESVTSGPISEFDRPRFIKNLTGRDIVDSKYSVEKSEEEILRVENFTRTGSFEDVNFVLNKGDVLGITGLLGSGRGEIGDALFGIAPADSGRVFMHGKEIKIKSIADAIRHKIGYVPEDRLTQGLFLDLSIQNNTVAASVKKYFKKGRINSALMYKDTEDWIKKIGCVAPSPKAQIRTLSGGNAQKMVIAKWLNAEPRLLILNGPTVGVDVGAKSDIHGILHKLAKEGVGIIVISDDLNELIINCNKIIVMKSGKISGIINSADYNESTLAELVNVE